MRASVYLAESGPNGRVKIGMSNDVDQRLRELQVGNDQRITMLAAIPFNDRKDAAFVEKLLHRTFAWCRVPGGEWFWRDDPFELFVDGVRHLEPSSLARLGGQLIWWSRGLDGYAARCRACGDIPAHPIPGSRCRCLHWSRGFMYRCGSFLEFARIPDPADEDEHD